MNKELHAGKYLKGFMSIEGIDSSDLADASGIIDQNQWDEFIAGDSDLTPVIIDELCLLFDFKRDLWLELEERYRSS